MAVDPTRSVKKTVAVIAPARQPSHRSDPTGPVPPRRRSCSGAPARPGWTCGGRPDTTVWVLGDQLGMHVASLDGAAPSTTRILVVESAAKVTSRPWHRQRLHLVLTAMRRFAAEPPTAGSMSTTVGPTPATAGLSAHVEGCGPPAGAGDGADAAGRAGAAGATRRRPARRCARRDRAVEPVPLPPRRVRHVGRRPRRGAPADGGLLPVAAGPHRLPDGRRRTRRWPLEPRRGEPGAAARDGRSWPAAAVSQLDDLDREVVAGSPEGVVGAAPTGIWPTSRRARPHPAALALSTRGSPSLAPTRTRARRRVEARPQPAQLVAQPRAVAAGRGVRSRRGRLP